MDEITTLQIRSLERTLLWTRVLVVGVLGCLILLLESGRVFSQSNAAARTENVAIPDRIQARGIEIINKMGQVIFSVSSDANQNGALKLNRANGENFLTSGLGDFGHPALAIGLGDGRPLVILGQSLNKQGGMLQIVSKDRIPVLWATTNEKGEGQLILNEKDGTTVKRIGPQP